MATKTKVSSKASRFILLPARGVRAVAANASPTTSKFLVTLHKRKGRPAAKAAGAGAPTIRVIESVHDDGAKLVEMRPADVIKLHAAQPGLRIVPEVFYYPAVAPRPFPVAPPDGVSKAAKTSKSATSANTATAAGPTITVKVVSNSGGAAIKACMVVAFTDFANRRGANGTTDAQGNAALNLGAASVKIERLYVYSPKGFWNGLKTNIT